MNSRERLCPKKPKCKNKAEHQQETQSLSPLVSTSDRKPNFFGMYTPRAPPPPPARTPSAQGTVTEPYITAGEELAALSSNFLRG